MTELRLRLEARVSKMIPPMESEFLVLGSYFALSQLTHRNEEYYNAPTRIEMAGNPVWPPQWAVTDEGAGEKGS